MASPAPYPTEKIHIRSGWSSKTSTKSCGSWAGRLTPASAKAGLDVRRAGILPMSGVSLTIGEGAGTVTLGFALARAVSDEAELLLYCGRPGTASARRLEVRPCFRTSSQMPARAVPAASTSKCVTAIQRWTFTGRAGFVPAGRRRNYYRGPDGKRYDAVTLMLIDDTP